MRSSAGSRPVVGRRNRGLFVGGVFGVGLIGWLLSGSGAQARLGEGVQPIILPGLVYQGNASCAGSNCHGADEATEQSGQLIGDENLIWSDSDPHAHAYLSLKEDLSKEICQKLNIPDPLTAERCLACHATPAPEDKRGELFSIEDAAGCESCHGPSEKWLNPHAEKGWTSKQRQAIGAKGLLEQFGLCDTSNLAVRANTCVACHLQTDKDMIDAGHPTQEFELYAYNYYTSKKPDTEFLIHWEEPSRQMRDAALWAVGQAASRVAVEAQIARWKNKGWGVKDAQGLLAIYEAGVAVAKKHFGADTVEGLAEARITPQSAAAAAADLAKTAPQASNPEQRRTIAFGVAALGSAVFDGSGRDIPDEFWEAYIAATSDEEGDPYLEALNQMVELANKQ